MKLIQNLLSFSLASLMLFACASAKPKQQSSVESSSDSFPIIDAHIHTKFSGEPESYTKIMQSQDELFKEMLEAGVTGAVSHTGQNGENYHDLKSFNIIHCAGVGAKVDVKRVDDGLKSGKYGCIKIYLGYVHQFAYDKNYQPVYKLAQKYHIPVVFHTGDTYSIKGKLKYADPLTIDEVAVDYPDVTFVIAHCGNPWIQSAAEVAYKNPNVYLDGSAFLVGDLSKYPQEELNEYIVKPLKWVFGYIEDPKKLMFGTDWPLTKIAPYVEAFKRAIPKEHWKAVFHDNAAHVFNLK